MAMTDDPDKPAMLSDEEWRAIKGKSSDPRALDGTAQPYPLLHNEEKKDGNPNNHHDR